MVILIEARLQKHGVLLVAGVFTNTVVERIFSRGLLNGKKD
jgi:hypothetical protein